MENVLNYLIKHPGWHHARDIVNAGVCGAFMIYVHLGRLTEEGYAEQRDGPRKPGMPRQQYRATGKAMPVHGEPIATGPKLTNAAELP